MTIKLNAATGGGSVSLSAPNSTTSNLDVELTLPVDDGAANTFLKSDGSGTLSWASASSDNITEGNTTVECVDTGSDGHITFDTEGSERARFDSSGRLLVGTTSAVVSDTKVEIKGNNSGSGGGKLSIAATGNWQDAGDLVGEINFANNSGGTPAIIRAQGDGFGGSGDYPGRLVFLTTPDSSSTPTERMRIWSDGSATIGSTTKDLYGVTSTYAVALNSYGAGDIQCATNAATVAFFNRCQNDGTIISLRQAGTEEGTISVSGSTVQLNGAHLSRWSQLFDGGREEILRGTVLTNLDEMCEWAYDAEPEVLWAEGDELPEGVSVGDVKTPAKAAGIEDNEQLNRMKVSDVEGDPNVAGVFVAWDDDDDTYTDDFYCAMTGDFVIRIAQGVTVQRGDLLMSAGDGTAKPQDDDIIRSKTIAKVTSTHVSETYADGSYCVPCVLMAC